VGSSICIAHEEDDLAPDASRIFAVKEELYIEPDSGPNDIAFVRVQRRTNGAALPFILIATGDITTTCPCASSAIPPWPLED
jgi:hypothetical protein